MSIQVHDLVPRGRQNEERVKPGVSTQVRYSVVIPVYNEQDVLLETYRRLKIVMDGVGDPYELLFVDDGSRDHSEAILESLCDEDSVVRLIVFSRNFGHQIAISAGMEHAAGDAVIVIDADLQDPPELIPKLIEQWLQGNEVVYAKRTSRVGETWFKRWTAATFYRMLHALTDVDIPLDTGDYRLIDRKVCDVMNSVRERNRFVRGLVSWAGFRQTAVEYTRESRFAGESKYSLTKMLKLSGDAVTSFSDKPLKWSMYAGMGIAGLSLLYVIASLIASVSSGHWVQGIGYEASLSIFFNGVVLFVLGVIGQYIARIYDETRDRPLYVVGSHKGFQGERFRGGR